MGEVEKIGGSVNAGPTGEDVLDPAQRAEIGDLGPFHGTEFDDLVDLDDLADPGLAEQAELDEDGGRRGWRERIETGLYRNHRVSCQASEEREPDFACDCPFQTHLPTTSPGRTYPQNLNATSLADARKEKNLRQRLGRRGRGGGKITVAEFFWGVFLDKQQIRPSTRRNYARVFRTLHEPFVGRIRLSELNEEHVAELIAHLEAQAMKRRELTGRRNAAWIAQQLIPLQSCLSAAVRWKRLSENPVRHPDLPSCPPKRDGETDCREDPKSILSKDQLELLYDAAEQASGRMMIAERDLSLFQVTYEFALRNSEARGLRWGDVDFDHSLLHVNRQIDPVTYQESLTKGKRSRRPPGGSEIFELLDAWYHRSVVVGGYDPDGYVWHGDNPDVPLPIGLPNRRIQRAQDRAGLVSGSGAPLIVFHGLRHSRASHLLLDGAPMLEVSRFLGHASQLVTANAYAHLVPDDEFSAIRGTFAGPTAHGPWFGESGQPDEPEPPIDRDALLASNQPG